MGSDFRQVNHHASEPSYPLTVAGPQGPPGTVWSGEPADRVIPSMRKAGDLREVSSDLDPHPGTRGRPPPTSPPATSRVPRGRSWLRDVLGLLWVLAAAGAVMTPALFHGASLGPFDYLSKFGLAQQSGVVVHNPSTADQINEFIPWSTLVWTQVHQGHLPLWNPYSALGTPLAFNWSSAPFSFPTLLGYLFPVRLAFTVQILATLVIAGTGVYVLGRVLGLGVLGCVMAATVFETSGSFVGWLGWPQAEVMSWSGWLFAAAILVMRGRHRSRDAVFLAVVSAWAVYAGQPETLLLLLVALLVFAAVLLALRTSRLRGSGPITRPAGDMAVALAAGLALGAPLLLPGYQLSGTSIRHFVPSSPALPFHDLLHVVFPGFDGLPLANSALSSGFLYFETAAYVGVIALVLAVAAVAVRWRSPEVVALGAAVAITAALSFVGPLVSLLNKLPLSAGIQWNKALQPMDFGIAVLAGVGLDVLVRSHAKRAVRSWLFGGFAAAGLMLAAIWIFDRGHLPSAAARFRAESFIWPAVATLLGLVVVGMLARAHRRVPRHQVARRWSWFSVGRTTGLVLIVFQTAFLVTSGAPLMSSSSSFFTSTPAEMALEHAVGSSVVGFGTPCTSQLGILPDSNVVYGVHELDVYDPILPRVLQFLASGHGPEPDVFHRHLLPRRDQRHRGPSFRDRLCTRAGWKSGTQGGRLRSGGRGPRGALPDPRGGRSHPDPGGCRRGPPVTRRRRPGRTGHPSRPGIVEARDRLGHHRGPAATADRRAGLARQHRRATLEAPAVLRGDAPSRGPPGTTHDRAALLAHGLHRGHRPGRLQRPGARRGSRDGKGQSSEEGRRQRVHRTGSLAKGGDFLGFRGHSRAEAHEDLQ